MVLSVALNPVSIPLESKFNSVFKRFQKNDLFTFLEPLLRNLNFSNEPMRTKVSNLGNNLFFMLINLLHFSNYISMQSILNNKKKKYQLFQPENGMEQEQNNLVAYDQETGGNFVMLNSNSHSHSHSTKCTSDDDSSSITSESGHLGVNSQSNSAHYSSSPLQMKLPKSISFFYCFS